MKKQLGQDIYWGETTREDYLYGSVIRRANQAIYFENVRFPSGKVIKKWTSRTNYQADRSVPFLPLLIPGVVYSLSPVMQVEPAGRVYLQLEFFNRQLESIGLVILKDGEHDFRYPQEAFTYTISLMSAGCRSLAFSHIALNRSTTDRVIYLSEQPRGYYAYGSYPPEIAFVRKLIPTIREKGAE